MLDEPADVAAVQQERDEQAQRGAARLEQRGETAARACPSPHVPWPELRATPIEAPPRRLSLSRWATGDAEAPDARRGVRLPFGPAAAYGGRLRVLAEEADADAPRAASRSSSSRRSRERLAELLEEHDVFARVAGHDGPAPQLGPRRADDHARLAAARLVASASDERAG